MSTPAMKPLDPAALSPIARVALLEGKVRRHRNYLRRMQRLLPEHEHTSARPGYPLEVLDLIREALGDV